MHIFIVIIQLKITSSRHSQFKKDFKLSLWQKEKKKIRTKRFEQIVPNQQLSTIPAFCTFYALHIPKMPSILCQVIPLLVFVSKCFALFTSDHQPFIVYTWLPLGVLVVRSMFFLHQTSCSLFKVIKCIEHNIVITSAPSYLQGYFTASIQDNVNTFWSIMGIEPKFSRKWAVNSTPGQSASSSIETHNI